MKNYSKLLNEKFGESIGSMAGQPMVGVRDERDGVCPHCGEMPVGGSCGCGSECPSCGEMPVGGSCGCGLREAEKTCECGMKEDTCQCDMTEAKKKGPSKKTAQKILRGTKTFKQKMKKVEKWADNPAAAAAWMQHRATGEWPSEK